MTGVTIRPRPAAARPVDTGRSLFTRFNPAVRLAAAMLIACGLIWSFDAVSAGVALVLELIGFAFLRVGWRAFWRRTAVVWIAAPISGIGLLLYGEPSGTHWFDFGLIHVTDGSMLLALAMTLRVLALALPAVVLFLGVDPTDFADSLVQVLRLPSRFVYGALGAVRLTTLFREDQRMLELARRARGVERRGLVKLLGILPSMLLITVRRGSALATAMEARGFGAPVERSRARSSRVTGVDAALMFAALVIPVVAVAVALVTGSWSPVLG